MLKVRIIPTLLWKEFGLVKGANFDSWRRVGPVLPAIKVYNQREVDELILLNVNAIYSSDEIDYETINEFGKSCFVPLTVGGGIKNIYEAQKLLRYGADKVSLNSNAYENTNLISDIAKRYGSQCVVASVDVRLENNDKSWKCYSHAGKKKNNQTEKIVMEAVNNLSKNTTIILISHRLSTVKNCDMIFLLEKGEIKNHGTFEELIKLNESFRINATN